MIQNEQTPVLIIGAGPVGLATAYVLGTHGVRSIVCEQYPGVNPHPRAHVVNTRSMELFRNWGIFDEIIDDAVDLKCGLSFVWKHTLSGEEFGRIDLADAPAAHIARRLNSSPVTIASCAQDRVQQRLLDAVLAQGLSTVQFGSRVTSVQDLGSCVEVSVEKAGRSEQYTADYVVAAEGASGSIRKDLEIAIEGIPEFGRQINVYFHADLTQWTTDDQALLFWVLNTTCPGVLIRMGGDRWTFNFGYDPADESVSDYTPERCAELIRGGIGVPDLSLDVKSVGTWILGASTAEKYREGRVFLVGDAAHQFPPTGGLGMNTGLVDADNLGWKLAAVANGWAPESLLDTYQTERRPIALANAQSSVANAIKMADAGIGPNTLEVASRLESADSGVAANERKRLALAVPDQRPHFDYLDLEIGYVYPCPDSESMPDEDPIAVAVPGGRLPHRWLSRDGQRISTLDLVHPGLTLIVGSDGICWATAMEELGRHLPTQTVVIGRDVIAENGEIPGLHDTGAMLIRPDGHVAWKVDRHAMNAKEQLRQAIDTVCATQSSR